MFLRVYSECVMDGVCEDDLCWLQLDDFRMLLIKNIDPSRITPYLRQCQVLCCYYISFSSIYSWYSSCTSLYSCSGLQCSSFFSTQHLLPPPESRTPAEPYSPATAPPPCPLLHSQCSRCSFCCFIPCGSCSSPLVVYFQVLIGYFVVGAVR